jgi:hypothetical protein
MKVFSVAVGFFAICFPIVISSYSNLVLAFSSCDERCQNEVACWKRPDGKCVEADPATCLTGWFRSGGTTGEVCKDLGSSENISLKLCNDCNPECPQNNYGEALSCADCNPEPFYYFTRHQCGGVEFSGPLN